MIRTFLLTLLQNSNFTLFYCKVLDNMFKLLFTNKFKLLFTNKFINK